MLVQRYLVVLSMEMISSLAVAHQWQVCKWTKCGNSKSISGFTSSPLNGGGRLKCRMLSKPEVAPPSMDTSCRPQQKNQTLALGSCLFRSPSGAVSGTDISRRQCLPGNVEEMILESMTSRFIGNGCCISFLIAPLMSWSRGQDF